MDYYLASGKLNDIRQNAAYRNERITDKIFSILGTSHPFGFADIYL